MKTKVIAAGLLFAAACATQEVKPAPKPTQVTQAPVAPPPEAPPAQQYADGQAKLRAKDYAGARASIEAYLAKEPKSAAGHFDAGWACEQAGDAVAARKHYLTALQLQPDHLGAALNVVRLYRADQRYDDAESLLNNALKLREGEPRLLNALSGVLLLEKKLDDAEKTAQRVLLRNPDDAAAHKNLALIEADRGRPKMAEAQLLIAQKLDPKDAGIVNNLGLLAAKRGEVPLARARFQEAANLDASFAPAWANLGALALQYRDYKAAADAYGKATALQPARAELHLAYGWALEGLKKPKDAREQYEAVLAAQPGDPDALYGRALALKAENNLPEAQKAFQAYAALPAAPKAKDAQSQLAQIEMRMKAAQPVAKAEVKRDAKGNADLSALPVGKDDASAPGEAAPPLPDVSDEPDVPATDVAKPDAPADKDKAQQKQPEKGAVAQPAGEKSASAR